MHTTNVMEPAGAIVPTLRYRDLAAAIDWLCNAFGFEAHHVVVAEDGTTQYAELTYGNGMIMLAPVVDKDLDGLMTQPADTGGAETQICYLFVTDIESHCARSREAGAEILLDLADADSDSRGYACRDLEGHVWKFGSYDPWLQGRAFADFEQEGRKTGRGRRTVRALAAVVAAGCIAATIGWALGLVDVQYIKSAAAAFADAVTIGQQDPRAQGGSARGAAPAELQAVKEQLAKERSERMAAERRTQDLQTQLARRNAEPSPRPEADPAMAELRQKLARAQSTLESEQRMAQELRDRVSTAEREREALRAQLADERRARESAVAPAKPAGESLAKQQVVRTGSVKPAAEARERPARKQPVRYMIRRVYFWED
ncbi:MAG TPA: VOC family protein [Hyphomicrobiaceae bacterium]|jgi:uncharacterized glyoxalase superfamily protein PhnB|nr:VOC family protein [Hyphomicrobiaceae bacterium]